MPRLHSGRLISLDTTPLNDLVTSIRAGGARDLADIRSANDVFERVPVLFFREAGKDGGENARNRYRVPTPPGMEPYASGYGLISIESAAAQWDERDRAGLRVVLNEERADGYFRNALGVVRECQRALLGEALLPAALDTWWVRPPAQAQRRSGSR